jgi:hypothetical protein
MARVGIFLGFLVLQLDARAATLTVVPDVAEVGQSVEFHITTEAGEWPIGGCDGAENATSVYFTGPCGGLASLSFGYGQSSVLTYPNSYWTNNYPCYTTLRPGEYLATLTYGRRDANCTSTGHSTDSVPFTVVGKLELEPVPDEIAVGDTVLIVVKNLGPGERATAFQIECPDGTIDSASTEVLSAIDDGLAVSWPSVLFEGTCDSTTPASYRVTLTTDRRSARTGFSVFGDADGDGWLDGDDNCSRDPNPGQEDEDGDNQGDACDKDRDRDGREDARDNCPSIANEDQANRDADGTGDVCDPDIDDDGVENAADNCDYHVNPGQENTDGDAFGDACDPEPDDSDNDAVSDLVDNCPSLFNPGQQDDDGDDIGSACDPDIDGDGIGNADEVLAGTDPVGFQPLEPGFNAFWDGEALGDGDAAPEGEPIGVVIDPVADTTSVAVTVFDPWGFTYAQQTLIPQSPVAFWFVPVFPGTWTLEAELDGGEVLTTSIQVIPEPGAWLAAGATIATLRRIARSRPR